MVHTHKKPQHLFFFVEHIFREALQSDLFVKYGKWGYLGNETRQHQDILLILL